MLTGERHQGRRQYTVNIMDDTPASQNVSCVENKTMDLDFTGRTTVAVFFIISAIIGIIGNIFVIFGVSISKKLWNSTGVLISNLAVADLLACMIVPWHAASMLSEHEQEPPFPQFICGTIAVMVVACVGCSMYTLAVIGINRMMLLSRHPAYDFVFQKKILVLIVIILWALPLSITLIPLTIGLGKVGYNDKFGVCTQMSIPKMYDKILMLGLCPIPYITIVFCYWKIYVLLSHHTSQMAGRKVTEPPLSSANNMDVIEGKVHVSHSNHSIEAVAEDNNHHHQQQTGSTHSNIKTNISKRQVEITKNLFYVVSAFVICVTPYAVCLMVEESDPAMPYTASLMLFNSCINPVIYATKHPYFKQVFRCIVKCRWHEVPKPSKFLKWWTRKTWCMSCKNGNRLAI